MFDIFGGSDDEARENIKTLQHSFTTDIVTILALLVDKGVFTMEEYKRARLRILPKVEQEIEEKNREAAQQWSEDHPEEVKTIEFLNKLLGGKKKDESDE